MTDKKTLNKYRYFWQAFILTLTCLLCAAGLIIAQSNTENISKGASAVEGGYIPMPARLNLSPLTKPPVVVTDSVKKLGAIVPAPLRIMWEGALGAGNLMQKLDELFKNMVF